ncbi:site-specific DNA-methyltransferase [bacterium]|nr:site-specific DNA-methyltransferase [bacterium]
MSDNKTLTIAAPKGRPMLTWVGKRPLRAVAAYPAQHIETFDPAGDAAVQDGEPWKQWPAGCPKGGLLFHGDNKEVLAHLLANGFRGKVNLIYIDPPFDSGADYVRKVSLRGPKGAAKMDGENYTIGEQIQYTDIWGNDNYLQFMYERLSLLGELLTEDGSIALHCDAKRSHLLRMLLEEVFGASNFRAEIIVRAGVKNVQSQFEEMSNLTLGSNTIFLYSKGTGTKYRKLQSVSKDHEPGKWDTFWRGTDRPTMRGELFGQKPADGQWRWSDKRAKKAIGNYEEFQAHSEGSISLDDYYLRELANGNDLDFVRLSPENVVQYYVPPRTYKLISNVWLDLPYRGTETDYPTEKSEAISNRLVQWVTAPGDIVLDCFIGSGTAAAVAQRLGRRWIACDINKGAIQTTSKRLQGIIEAQIAEWQAEIANPRLPATDTAPPPAQFSFTVWRVNDYDLQVQHNEAVELACQVIGVQRNRTDTFFDGTRGQDLVRVIPFNHPLCLTDLEEIKQELEARKTTENAVAVCLGKELTTDAWLEDHNRLRRGKNAANRIEVIELRTDARYGGFLQHEPATARVTIKREREEIAVTIKDFCSPTIIKRLQQQAGIVQAHIDDWRQMVDCVMIDPAYDGEVFNIALSDVPEKKADFVEGEYRLPASKGRKTTVAVKIMDMLGEEVLVTGEA